MVRLTVLFVNSHDGATIAESVIREIEFFGPTRSTLIVYCLHGTLVHMKRSLIDANSDTPIFQQIVEEIERQIITGELKANDFLTSVREFALRIEVNPNTVSKAYQQLQSLGLVEAVRGTGLKVKVPSSKRNTERRDQLMREKLDECIAFAKSLGISKDELIRRIKERGQ